MNPSLSAAFVSSSRFQIPEHDVGSAGDETPDLTWFYVFAGFFVDDANGDTGDLATAACEPRGIRLAPIVGNPPALHGGEEGSRFGEPVGLEQHRAEDFRGGLESVHRHRRAAEEDHIEAAGVAGADVREVRQKVDHGGHENRLGHSVRLDRLERPRRRELVEKDVRPPDQRDRVASPGVRQVEHGSGVKPDIPLLESERQSCVLRIGDDVSLAEHHTFRETGGAARIAEIQHLALVPGASRSCEWLATGDELLVIGHPVDPHVIEKNSVLDFRRLLVELPVEIDVLGPDEDGFDVAIVEDELGSCAARRMFNGAKGIPAMSATKYVSQYR